MTEYTNYMSRYLKIQTEMDTTLYKNLLIILVIQN